MNAQNIYYTNSIPGSGKTRWAIEYIKKYLKSNSIEKTSLIIYCAPTKALLNEVYSKIMEDTSIDRKKVFLFTSDNYQYVNQVIENSFSLYEKGKQNKAFINKLDKVDTRLLNAQDQIALKPGSVLLITHEAFWNASFSNENQTFKDKENTTLIIDEARDCYIKTINFQINSEKAQEFEAYLGVNKDSEFILINPKKLSKAALLANNFNQGTFICRSNRILEELDNIARKSNIDIYVYSTYDELISSYSISVIRAPYDALYGWKKVIALAAFYESSQMYHLIQSANTNDKIQYKYKHIDISNKVINSDHLNIIKERLKKTSISWIFSNNASAYKYTNYVAYMHKGQINADRKEKILKYCFSKAKKDLSLISQKLSKPVFVKLLKSKKAKDLTPTNYLDGSFFENRYTKDHIVPCSPTAFAALYSYMLAKAWFAKEQATTYNDYCKEYDLHDYGTEKLTLSEYCNRAFSYLLSVNVYCPYTDYTANSNFISKNDDIDPKDLTFETSKLANSSNWTINVPDFIQEHAIPVLGDVRGSNAYMNNDIMTVISSYIVQPALKSWFKTQCPSYNPDEDFTLGQTIQVMMRCSIRNSASTKNALIILNSKSLAEDIKKKLFDLPKLLSPSELDLLNCTLIKPIPKYDDSYAELVSKESIERNNDAAKMRMRKYYKTDTYIINKIKNLENKKILYKDLFLQDKNASILSEIASLRNRRNYFKRKNNFEQEKSLTDKLKSLCNELKQKRQYYVDEFENLWENNKDYLQKVYKEAANVEYAKRLKKIDALRNKLNNQNVKA